MKPHRVTYGGPAGKANVGISNDKAGEKPAHRKAKGFYDNVNRSRVSRDLSVGRRGIRDGKPVNIPALIAGTNRRDGEKICTRTDGIVR